MIIVVYLRKEMIGLANSVPDKTLKSSTKELAVFDIVKMIFAFFVVCIHTGVGMPDADFYLMQSLFRTAVPSFFFLAGYFLFGKFPVTKKLDENSRQTVKKYIIRIFMMYVMWSLFYLITVQLPGWLENGVGVKDFLIYAEYTIVRGDSYLHLWYLAALYTGMALMYICRKRFDTKVTLIISFVFFISGLLLQPYYFLIAPAVERVSVAKWLFEEVFNRFIGSPRCGLFFGFMFVALGAYFAEHKKIIKRWVSLAGVVVSFGLSMIEVTVIDKNWFWGDGTYGSVQLSHIPITIFLFCFLCSFDNVKIKYAKEIRTVSTLIYLLHPAVMLCVKMIPNFGQWRNYPFAFGIVVYLLSIIVSVVWIKLEELKPFVFLKKLR